MSEPGPKLTAFEQGDKVIVNYYQDIEPHLKDCAARRREDAEVRTTFGKRKEFRHAMRVPENIYYSICNRLGIPIGDVFQPEHSKRIMEELKREEFRAFRVVNDVNI